MLSSALTLVRRHLPEEFFSYAFYIQVTAVPGASDSFGLPVPLQPEQLVLPELLVLSGKPWKTGIPLPLLPLLPLLEEKPALPDLPAWPEPEVPAFF